MDEEVRVLRRLVGREYRDFVDDWVNGELSIGDVIEVVEDGGDVRDWVVVDFFDENDPCFLLRELRTWRVEGGFDVLEFADVLYKTYVNLWKVLLR